MRMASEKESPCQNYCANDPNFAIICSFFDRFALSCGITCPTFAELQEMIENTLDVPPELIDLHVKLLRKIRRSVAAEKWERALIKFCHSYLCSEEGWELERCGYKKCKVPIRLKILKTLLDAQFDLNSKFKNDINKLTPEELRLEPLGRDKVGQSYWCQFDSAANVRVYKEDQDEETWALVAKDREGLVSLITQLSSGEELLELELINEDSNSQEVEKPIIDTGQVEQSTSEENTVDSDTSKSGNPVKEEDSSTNDISRNSVNSNDNFQTEVLENDKSSKIKEENYLEKIPAELKISTNEPSDDPDQVCPPSFADECEKNKLEKEQKSDEVSPSESESDQKHEADSEMVESKSSDKAESKSLIENGISNESFPASQQPNADSALETGEIKDVAEEIKQRSLFKSSSTSLFKGFIGKSSSGSKLEKIFSHKLEQSNLSASHDKSGANEGKKLDSKSVIDDDSCSQSSVLSNEQGVLVCDEKQGKRKADEMCDQISKKPCIEEVGVGDEPEVGEEIEEPLMIIKGEGSGQECDTGNPGKDNEEDVTSENLNNTISNKSDGTLHHATNESNSEDVGEGISIKINLNNGLLNDNDVKPKQNVDCIPNCVEPSKKDDKSYNLSNDKEPHCTVDANNKDEEEPKLEKSIEEQLSDLTGEGLSPKPNNEHRESIENSTDFVDIFNNKNPEKGIRRKSLDATDNVDHESVPPEAKKTKVQEDCNDIFGADDSMSYLNEENKTVGGKPSLSEIRDKNVLNNDSEKETSDVISANSNLCTLNKSETAQNKTASNLNEEASDKEIVSLEKKLEPNESEESVPHDSEQKIINEKSESNLKDEKGFSENEVKDIDKLKGPYLDKVELVTDGKKSKLDLEVKDEAKSSHKKHNDSVDGNVDNIDSVEKALKNKESESPEKKKKIELDDGETTKENATQEGLGIDDKKSENSDSSLKDEGKESIQKRKTPLKKSPKPRKKVFTPKSRKSKNKNKDNKEDKLENGSSLGEKGNTKISNNDENKSSNEVDATHNEENTSENEPTKQTMAKSIAGRKRRNSRKITNTEKESEEDLTSDKKANTEADDEEVGGKRRKVKAKRTPNKNLRKSVEDKRNSKSSSEEENDSDENIEKETKKSPKETKKTPAKQKPTAKSKELTKSNQGKTKPVVKSTQKSKKDSVSKAKKEDIKEDDKSDESSEKKKKKFKPQGRNSRAYLGINLDIDLNDTSRSVRQSSRIAQIKIKEQADHKHGEDHQNTDKPGKKSKKKKDENEEPLKGTPKKKKKAKKTSDEDVPEDEPLSERKRKRRKKKKHPVKAFNELNPWKSSSGSSTEAEEEEEDHFDDIVEEEDDIPLTIKSDHEFSPESDLEADEEWKPVRRARTAQKVKEPTEEAEDSCKDLDDFACEKCGKKDHPEWILLCDTCNHGWHASCLRPSLMLVPEGDWHCPPCQHTMLVKKLQETLKIYDRDTKRRENEELRKKRLAYVGISLDNVLPGNAHHPRERASGSESSESSESRSDSESEYSDEPVYQLRQRRQGTTSYRFNEFDELINSAIRDEVEESGGVLPIPGATVEGSADVKEGRDKPQTAENDVKVNGESQANDVPVAKEKSEKPKKKNREESEEDSSEDEDSKNEDEEDEFPRVVPKRTSLPQSGRKKHRKLNSLDDPSDDDDDDEDFKGSSSEEEEEEEEEDDSDESGVGRRRSRRGNMEPVRRSSRARKSRFDKEFINDDSEESDAPRRKKTKKLWNESDSESDDSTWGRRKKKKGYSSSRGKKFQKSKKFTIEDELSDLESSKTPKKKRQRKVKYGGLDDLAVEDLPSRRTRGKKINYQEVLGTDSDEDVQKSKSFKKAVIEDDDEFDADKEKQESAPSSGDEEESEKEGKSSDEEDEESEDESKSVKEKEDQQNKEVNKNEIEGANPLNEKVNLPSNKVSPPKAIPHKVSPPKVLIKDKPPARRGRPPKAMIAPPPERLISEDEQYKAVVSKVATVGHTLTSVEGPKAVNVSDYPQKFSETKDFIEPLQPVTPVKIPNSSFDPKFVKRSPPIKIRSGVPVNAVVKGDSSLYPVKSPNSESLHSPPDQSQFHLQRPTNTRKSINVALANIKSEAAGDEEDFDDEDLMEEIEEEEEDDEEDDSDDEVLEEGEIPKKVARRMARMEERLEKRKLARQMEKLKGVQTGAVTIQPVSPGAAQPPPSATEQKPTPTTQPSQPLLRVVSPLKLMANPPGPLQSTFMNTGLSPRMPIGSPPPARIPMPMRPSQPSNIAAVGDASSRRGRGRGKKPEKEEVTVATGGSVIRGMLQQPQSYPPSHYQQQYPPSHPRIPFNPQQRLPRPPFHPHPMDPSPSGGGPINVKQEPGAHPVSSPVHIPNKPPVSQPYHPQHRFDSRPPGYPPQGNPRPQYGSYPPPPVSGTGYHYGSYPPPPPPAREEYVTPPHPQYNEQFSEQSSAPVNPPPTNKTYSEEEGGGEFGGLVSYFSSQREDDIDT